MSGTDTNRNVSSNGQRPPRRPLAEGEIVGKNGGILRPMRKGETRNPTALNLDKYHEVRRLASAHSVDAMDGLIRLMKSDDDRVAYMAMVAVLERGVGKPRPHDEEEEMRLNMGALSAADRAVLATLLQRALGIAPQVEGNSSE